MLKQSFFRGPGPPGRPVTKALHARSPGLPPRVRQAAQRSYQQAPQQLPERIRSLKSLSHPCHPEVGGGSQGAGPGRCVCRQVVLVDISGTDPLAPSIRRSVAGSVPFILAADDTSRACARGVSIRVHLRDYLPGRRVYIYVHSLCCLLLGLCLRSPDRIPLHL
jgi:hypothetical protein